MKKFASLVVALLLIVSMVATGLVSASALTGLNSQTKGTLTLTKLDPTKPDGENGVEGATFTAYKVLALNIDADQDGTYTVADEFASVIANSDVDMTKTGKLSALGALFDSTDKLQAIIKDLEKVAKTGTESTELGKGKYEFKNMDLGVYLIVETVVPAGYIKTSPSFLVSIPEWTGSEWNYNIAAKPKNTEVNIVKKIGSDVETGKDTDAYAIGQSVPYVVEAVVPDYGYAADNKTRLIAALTDEQRAKVQIAFLDVMTEGLTYNEDLVVTIDGTDVTSRATAFNANKSEDFAVKFDAAFIEEFAGKTIKLNYSARLNEKARITKDGNVNTIEYHFNPDLVYNPEDPNNPPPPLVPEPPTDSTTVYTYKMNVIKTFEGQSAEEAKVDASAVKFTLMDKASKKNIKLVKLSDGQYAIYDADKYKGEDNLTLTTEIQLTKAGTVGIKGLDEGTYYLEETATVANYNKLTTRVEIKVVAVKNETTGEITFGVYATNYTMKNGKVVETSLNDGSDNEFDVTINNVKKQFDLPQTGGNGILLFTIAGGILMAAAIILFATLRKKREA